MKAIINLPEDFKKGNCKDCPFYIDAWEDEIGQYGLYHYCLFGYDCEKCGLEIRRTKNDNKANI